MTIVSDILKSKASNAIHSIAPGDSVLDALKLMAEKGIGALLVMEGKNIVGIVTERDYARKIALLGRTSAATLVRDVMTRDVLYWGKAPDATLLVGCWLASALAAWLGFVWFQKTRSSFADVL